MTGGTPSTGGKGKKSMNRQGFTRWVVCLNPSFQRAESEKKLMEGEKQGDFNKKVKRSNFLVPRATYEYHV